VAELFREYGAGIIDTDAISHQLTQDGGGAIAPIRAEFGETYITAEGMLDRARMRRLIFSDGKAKQRLEHILHPLIFEQAKAQLKRLRTAPYIIIVVPLLPDSPEYRQLVQRVLVVDCDESDQIARINQRSGMTAREVQAIIAHQTPRHTRLHLADDIIHNDAGMDSLAKQVDVLHRLYSSSPPGH